MNVSQTIVSREVKRYLSAERMNQTQLGARIGLQQTTVSARLRGKTRWTLDDLDRLCDAGILDYNIEATL